MDLVILNISLIFSNFLIVTNGFSIFETKRVNDTSANFTFIQNCINNSSYNEESCGTRRVNVMQWYYTCEVLANFDAAPKRIGIKNDSIFAAVNSQTFSVTDINSAPEEVNTVISPEGTVVDSFENRYYVVDGIPYVMIKSSGKEIEIETSRNYSQNELVIDNETNQLYILSFNIDRNRQRSGSLFILKTDQLSDSKTTMVAQRVNDFGEELSAINIPKTSSYLILGVNNDQGGKLLKLSRKQYDPCSPGTDKRNQFKQILKNTTDELLKMFDEALQLKTGKGFRALDIVDTSSELRQLRTDKNILQHKLNITTEKLFVFMRRLSVFSSSLKKIQHEETIHLVSSKGTKHKSNNLECLPAHEISNLRSTNEVLQDRVNLFESIFTGVITALDGFADQGMDSGNSMKETSKIKVHDSVQVSTSTPSNGIGNSKDLTEEEFRKRYEQMTAEMESSVI